MAATARCRLLCLGSLGAFLLLAVTVWATGVLPGDVQVHEELVGAQASLASKFFRYMNFVGTWRVLIPVGVVLFWLSREAKRHPWLWLGALAAAGIGERLFKLLIGRERPNSPSSGFPSGHTTAITAFAVIVVYLAARERLSPAWRRTIQITALGVMVLVGLARVVTNRHWPSDVLGGLLLGMACGAAAAWWDSAVAEPRASDVETRA
ncbi:MAG TPA: phosphatase PAP2 family protein [Methylomirabilota bacterium]|nr:phosphatase PAP2 family protein [Methylomirabilota bacterium]